MRSKILGCTGFRFSIFINTVYYPYDFLWKGECDFTILTSCSFYCESITNEWTKRRDRGKNWLELLIRKELSRCVRRGERESYFNFIELYRMFQDTVTKSWSPLKTRIPCKPLQTSGKTDSVTHHHHDTVDHPSSVLTIIYRILRVMSRVFHLLIGRILQLSRLQLFLFFTMGHRKIDWGRVEQLENLEFDERGMSNS